MSIQVSFSRTLQVIVCLIVCVSLSAVAQNRRAQIVGRRAVVCDERLSALRLRPEVDAPLVQRLRRGRIISVIDAARSKEGWLFLRVAVTRRTRGWILAEATVRRGRREDSERLLRLIENASDELVKLRLARIYIDEFRGTPAAARALLQLGNTAELVAQRLTHQAKRRLRMNDEQIDSSDRRIYLMNDIGLDRYNRIGIRFKTDATGEQLLYDGAAWRELLRRYPHSTEAAQARERIDEK